ncbi:hypothetical protein GF325_15735 [Candidatus Bathyarchaeota archaeon]|nr:hypothetical protein [Candidatus Bathyarchaeota archaeon]
MIENTRNYRIPPAEWRVVDDKAYPVHLGLSIDEALVELAAISGSSDNKLNVIRFYQFAPPCVVLGLHQDPGDIHMEYISSRQLQVGRRITGGGAIIMGVPDEDSQVGISIIYQHDDGFPLKLGSRYALLASPIVHALRSIGIDARYQSNSDITVGGKKIAGQAIFSTGTFTFMHSTVNITYDLPTMLGVMGKVIEPSILLKMHQSFTTLVDLLGNPNKGEILKSLKGAIVDAMKEEWKAKIHVEPLKRAEMQLARRMEREKHSNPAYIFNREGTGMGSCFTREDEI